MIANISLQRFAVNVNRTYLPIKIQCLYRICAMIDSLAMFIFIRKLQVYCNRRFIPILSIFSFHFCTWSETNSSSQVKTFCRNFFKIETWTFAKHLCLFTVRNDSMLSDKVNCILSVLTGLSSFSSEICARFVPHLGKILRSIDHSEVSFTAIKCLGYLCKK